jgi:hypothetical protein
VTVFWPAGAAMMVAGLVVSLVAGSRTFLRAVREGANAPQGLFLWSCSLLWYSDMSLGGLFFHCLHIRKLPHIADLIGTGLASLSVIAGFAAFRGKVDDRTTKQRLLLLFFALVFIAVVIVSPPLLQEQLYVVPSLLATGVGVWFLPKSLARIRRVGLTTRQQAAHREAQRWLNIAGLGVVMGLGCLPLDKYLCVYLGAHFNLIFWFFLGCNIAIFSTHQFALVVVHNNLHFTDIKAQ